MPVTYLFTYFDDDRSGGSLVLPVWHW